MSEENHIEKLKSAPITELNFGTASLRRVIKRAGFDTLPDLLDLPEKRIDDLFELRVADEIIKLQEQYHADSEAFAALVLQKKEVNRAAVNRVISKAKPSDGVVRKSHASTTLRAYYSGDGAISLPPLPFSEKLKEFEGRAREALNDLDDRFQTVMAYQAFEEFSTDLDELNEAFSQLFAHYETQPRIALNLIDKHLHNAFIIYVADRARSTYRDGNLWGNFFDGLINFDSSNQSVFKQIFVNHIEHRGMPLYARGEETHYYFYTALLHGGLSADSWENLWEKSILPLAKEVAKGSYGFGGEMDGYSILRELKNPESRFSPNKSVLNILEKAPDSTIAPLFESSMRVATQIESSKGMKNGYTMLSNFGLPEAAMQALREYQENTTQTSEAHLTTSSHEKRRRKHRLVYLPMASLQLNLAEGTVSICWPRQQFPLHFADARIDYYVDGKLKLSSPFNISVGKCILDTSSIAVKPQARYDIELKLMQKDEETDEYEEISSLHQTFTRNKPGCFEFIKSSKGPYRLRNRDERITKRRRVAYIVKEGYKIVPDQGMTAVEEYETSDSWDGRQILIYDIEPGSAGSIVNALTGEKVAVWQERYTAKVDKRRIIGETLDGIDLYGYAPNELGTNDGLPSVTIKTFDGLSALRDLDIRCICDGQEISLPRHSVEEDAFGESNVAQITLAPQESNLFDWHIQECLIEVRQKSTSGKLVFRYRFAVIPIRDFRPMTISYDFGIATAEYGFQTSLAIDVVNSQGESESVNAWGRYTSKTLLKDEFLHLRIHSQKSGKETDAKLALAAVDIEIPDKLSYISKKHPICLADVLELGPSVANFKILSTGQRYNRAAIVMLGMEPIFFKELKQPGEHEFNLFRRASSFQQADNSKPNNRPLRLSLIYGDDVTQGYLRQAWTDVEILDCSEGIGILNWKLLVNNKGEHVLRFEGRPVCDVFFEFKRRANRKSFAEASALADAAELVLPSNVVRSLNTQKSIIVEMSPCDWLGDPQREYVTSFILER